MVYRNLFHQKKSKFEKASEVLKSKDAILKDRLRSYLASLTLEQVSGEKAMSRIKREIRDLINAEFWPEQKPRVDHVIFEDWAVQ